MGEKTAELQNISPEQGAAILAKAGFRVVDRTASRNSDRSLEVLTVRELVDRVQQAGAASWLVEGLWPAGAYGVLGAEDKSGKTWAALDLAVSVATGTPWFGHYRCENPGPALVYLGEGGERASLRRLEAIVASKGGTVDDLTDLRIALSVPRLADVKHVAEVRAEVEANEPRLVVVDPLYLAAAGAKGSDLYGMGEVLGPIQRACQDAGAALVVVTHWNKTGEGSGARRFTGVGPGAWGRVLGSAAVEHRTTEPDRTSNVLLRWEFTGSEISDRTFRVRRRIRAEGEELEASLVYDVEVSEEASIEPDGLSPSQRRVKAVLDQVEAPGLTPREIGDRLATDGQGAPLQKRTINRVLGELLTLGLVNGTVGDRREPGRWWGIG